MNNATIQPRRLTWVEAEATTRSMIGELCREGRKVFYVWPQGGRYVEGENRRTLISYLLRKHYV